VRIVDVLTAALSGLALLTALGANVRVSVGGIRLAISSPLRSLAIALVLVVVRHALVREQPLPRRLVNFVRAVRALDGWSAAWPAFVATRVAVLLIGLLAVHTVGYPLEAPPYRISQSEITNLPMRWDAGWYMGIATNGYQWDPVHPRQQQNIAFFPAYPLLTRLAGQVLGDSLSGRLLAGVLLSEAAFLWGLIYLYRLVRDRSGDEGAAARAVLLLAAYPFALFHGAVYTESLFMLGCLGAILNLDRGMPLPAAGWGLLVGLTRPNGFLLSATLAALAWARRNVGERPRTFRAGLPVVLAVAAPIVGTALYSAYVAVLTGHPLQWSAQHAAWGRVYRGAAPFLDPAAAVARYGFETYVRHVPYDAMNAAAVVFAVALIIPVWRWLGLPYAVFLGSNLLPPLLLGGVMSMGRLTSTMFPLFMCLGLWCRKDTAQAWAVAFAAGQAFLAVLFYTWRPLY